ncbi:PREDICTED: uncharacterized protein LOC109116833 [Tarenaya hassleriana]|uniref:uncharacterized protein LOC109116833 n=1 Tax=Tarenaya hassleriana TaxID=28532 RepID=UPI0008FD4879|nr:PREDICTED: uncharacterized protein LOC109116833 [Tarenaya hassleriana]
MGSPYAGFLESCSLCRKPLGLNSDIYMYRGDTAFCSEECREEQMDLDEARERNWKGSSRSVRTSAGAEDSSAGKIFQTGTLVVA